MPPLGGGGIEGLLRRQNLADLPVLAQVRPVAIGLGALDARAQIDAVNNAVAIGAGPAVIAPAASAVAILESHPAFEGHRTLQVVLPVFGPNRDEDLSRRVSEVLVNGMTALLSQGGVTAAQIQALIQTAFGADVLSGTLRCGLTGDPWTDLPSPSVGSFDPLGSTPGGVAPLPASAARACLNDISQALTDVAREAAVSSEASAWWAAHPSTVDARGIRSISPKRGCDAVVVHIRGRGFGPQNSLVRVVFTSTRQTPAIVSDSDVVSWNDTDIVVHAPNGVGAGPVGFLRTQANPPPSGDTATVALAAAAVISECLGVAAHGAAERIAAVGMAFGVTTGMLPLPPQLPRGVNRFAGGKPGILEFGAAVVGGGTTLAPGGSLRLHYNVENATQLTIVPFRNSNGDRTQLPPVVLPTLTMGNVTVGPIPGDWSWDGGYELRAENTCTANTPVSARVTVAMSRARPSFLWGVATCGGQYEGGLVNDWQLFTTNPVSLAHMVWAASMADPPDIIPTPEPPGEALRHADPYVFSQDALRASSLGLNAYRMSIEWSRVQPTHHTTDPAAFTQVYLPMLRALRRLDIEPVVTLQHLTLPQWVLTPSVTKPAGDPSLEPDAGFNASLGGWSMSATVDAYVDYVDAVVSRLVAELGADVPQWWVTLNEPVGSMVGAGYIAGLWPPGFSAKGALARDAYLNLLKAHVRAYDVIKKHIPTAMISIAQNMPFCEPLQPDPAGNNLGASNQSDYWYTWHFLDSVTRGTVDVAMEARPANRNTQTSQEFFGIAPADWTSKLDYVGVNYYRAWYIQQNVAIQPVLAAGFIGGQPKTHLDPGSETRYLNDMGWITKPDALLEIPHQDQNGVQPSGCDNRERGRRRRRREAVGIHVVAPRHSGAGQGSGGRYSRLSALVDHRQLGVAERLP